ncbi:hypothetical protein Q3G72_018146 [Acer saccharum]|nr:hypothetical protein Q3G72_018146 [Acer saccharum]
MAATGGGGASGGGAKIRGLGKATVEVVADVQRRWQCKPSTMGALFIALECSKPSSVARSGCNGLEMEATSSDVHTTDEANGLDERKYGVGNYGGPGNGGGNYGGPGNGGGNYGGPGIGGGNRGGNGGSYRGGGCRNGCCRRYRCRNGCDRCCRQANDVPDAFFADDVKN